MTDTQADLMERARALAQQLAVRFTEWIVRESNVDFWSENNAEDRLAEMSQPFITAALQSEREAAAAEARRAAIEECHIKALEQRCEPTFLNDGGVIHRAGERTPWDLACTTIADAISALASPAPQEDKR